MYLFSKDMHLQKEQLAAGEYTMSRFAKTLWYEL